MCPQFGTGAEVSYGHFGTSTEMSWVRSVLGPNYVVRVRTLICVFLYGFFPVINGLCLTA